MSQVKRQFDPKDPKYICCCGCHVMTGAEILALIDIVSTVLYAVYIIGLLSFTKVDENKSTVLSFCSHLVGFLISAIIAGLFWYGLIKERHGFLIPTLICSLLVLMVTVPVGAAYVAVAISLMPENFQLGSTLLLTSVAAFGGAFGLQYWFYWIVKSAYSYIEQKRYSVTNDDFIAKQMEQACVAVPQETPTAPPAYEEAAAYTNFSEKMVV
uniref:Transmembrane protein n=1 Tax=Plectus sambesii TaxID=2011161 RepID=A0A914WBW3_9BILA